MSYILEIGSTLYGLDLRTPAGRLMANVLASVSMYEIEVKKERQMAGIRAYYFVEKSPEGSRLTVFCPLSFR